LIADDHPVVRDGLAALLERLPDMQVVGKASTGAEAVTLFRQQPPDVTLMDLKMPQMDGFEAISTLRAEFPNARILVLTTFEGEEDIYRAVRRGARGYLLKDAPCERLQETIRAVAAGQVFLPPEMASRLAERMSRPELTAREREVLTLLAAGKNNQEIGTALHVAESTVKSHVNAILSKLGVSDRTQAALVALQRGLVQRR
jgi:two-component system NarL family response regulator